MKPLASPVSSGPLLVSRLSPLHRNKLQGEEVRVTQEQGAFGASRNTSGFQPNQRLSNSNSKGPSQKKKGKKRKVRAKGS